MNYRRVLCGMCAVLGVGIVSNVALPQLTKTTYESVAFSHELSLQEVEKEGTADTRRVLRHVPLPKAVKGVYMTSCVVGTPSFRDSIVSLIDETEVNAVVIDIKDYSGTLSFPPTAEALLPAWDNARCGTSDMEQFVKMLHENGIYVIGRITVFQDPFYSARHPAEAVHRASDGSVWKDYKGLSFIDVGAKAYWDYIISLSTDAYNIGFDELNFDYVRYPSDGNMQDVVFTNSAGKSKPENLESFFKYLSTALSDERRYENIRHENTGRDQAVPYLSVDLFGMTTSSTHDLSIGQVEERAAPYFDFIAPMVYPSHYPNGFIGFGNPNHYPYEIVQYALTEGARRLAATTTSVDGFTHTRLGTSTPAVYQKPAYDIQKLRPWLQDFDYGGEYGVTEVRAQIQATYDAGLTGWMIWDPGNRYTRDAYLPEQH